MAAWLVTSVQIAACAQAAQTSMQDFRAWAMERLPTGGAWRAVYVPSDPASHLEAHVGYDWGTRAYYSFSGAGGMARDAEGRCFAFEPNLRQDPMSLPDEPGNDEHLDEFLPAILLRDLVEREHEFRSIQRGPEGGYRVVVAWPHGGRRASAPSSGSSESEAEVEPAPILDTTMWFDSLGRLTRREHVVNGLKMAIMLEYDERSPGGFPVASRSTHEMSREGLFRTISKDLYLVESLSGGLREHFGLDRLRRDAVTVSHATGRSLANHTRILSDVAMPLNGSTPTPIPEGAGELAGSESSRVGRATRPWSKFQLPLVVGGILVASIGVIAWWRRARA